MLDEQVIHVGRTEDYTVDLFEADDETAVPLSTNDIIRVKVYRDGQTPVLDLSSGAATVNGSSVQIATVGQNVVNVRFAEADTASLDAGPYMIEINVVDGNDTAGPPNPTKFADWGVVHFTPSGGGNVGP